ncbi:uncharacterized protein [Physcomitrium patens]|uniref:Uncharacterized protein n=1 Tax=Physcomitrium patens TaxID=3218 RepID=A9SZV1_PHYPA|nr:heat shock 70 kDa protein 12B-like [Physcomitrium patens]PNR55007.1 hypothetical protein PHYPA_005900 [Physcomitrium patens]|eukprot:XP_024372381.1 heat shock 70 kDa protein 12B-like [Physcomitrella patens]
MCLLCKCSQPSTSDEKDWGNGIPEIVQSTTDRAAGGPARDSQNVMKVDSSVSRTKTRPKNPIRWVVGLDFGTTYSGYAYTKVVGNDQSVYVNYEWPCDSSGRFYCKNLTGLYYQRIRGPLECMSWGHRARSDHLSDKKPGVATQDGHYLSRFKLLLKGDLNDPELRSSIPYPLTVNQVIADYLKRIGGHVLEKIKNHDGDAAFVQDSVQWCVSVPSIWDDYAKQQMKACMVDAGLVSEAAGGAEAVKVVLEPEAASFYCHEILRADSKSMSLFTKDKVLVVDIGGGTVDIVCQELLGSGENYEVRELTESSGGLCGGTFVDKAFMRLLSNKVPCLDEFLRRDCPSYKTRLLKDWEDIKCTFGEDEGTSSSKSIDLHLQLSKKWEAFEKQRGRTVDTSVVELTERDLKSIFDPVVEDILQLIDAQLRQALGVKAMFVVGGFAGSKYLMRRIRSRFAHVENIISPPNPGSAIIQGAVLLARKPEVIVERVLRKTYGTSVSLPFEPGDREDFKIFKDGKKYCRRFDKFVTKGDRIKVSHVVTKEYVPLSSDQDKILFDLYSTDQKNPRYVQDTTVTKEGQFVVTLPKFNMNNKPKFDFSLYFGGSNIELRAGIKSRTGESTSLRIPVRYQN